MNLERLLHVLRGHFGVVDGAIVIRVRVQIAAERLRLPSNLADRVLRCSLEEHVLDHMGNSGNAIVLVKITGFDIGRDAHERHSLLLANDNG